MYITSFSRYISNHSQKYFTEPWNVSRGKLGESMEASAVPEIRNKVSDLMELEQVGHGFNKE